MINLDPNLSSYGWHANGENPTIGTYLDADGFNEINVFAVEDHMATEWVATVMFAGMPVLQVRSGHERDAYVRTDVTSLDDGWQQTYVAFLLAIGEVDEDAVPWAAAHSYGDIWETEYVGDGHALAGFVTLIARALHAALPDETSDPGGW